MYRERKSWFHGENMFDQCCKQSQSLKTKGIKGSGGAVSTARYLTETQRF